ncbi:HK97 gp10 family phage protein [Paracoccus sp. p3-h83]|uniref:HK97 gp10 family phage protein n=1 Tax=Paracoccus sp. p3-h83 TaxID=3342805 RepID=UPI0035B84342
MADLAASLAPRDTGSLAESIVVSAKAKGAGADRGRSAFAAAMRGGASKKEAGAAKRAAIASAMESGEVPSVELFMGPAKGSKRAAIKSVVQEFGSRKQAPHPYMRPAWDRDQAALLERVTVELRSAIDKAVARATKAGKLRG